MRPVCYAGTGYVNKQVLMMNCTSRLCVIPVETSCNEKKSKKSNKTVTDRMLIYHLFICIYSSSLFHEYSFINIYLLMLVN